MSMPLVLGCILIALSIPITFLVNIFSRSSYLLCFYVIGAFVSLVSLVLTGLAWLLIDKMDRKDHKIIFWIKVTFISSIIQEFLRCLVAKRVIPKVQGMLDERATLSVLSIALGFTSARSLVLFGGSIPASLIDDDTVYCTVCPHVPTTVIQAMNSLSFLSADVLLTRLAAKSDESWMKLIIIHFLFSAMTCLNLIKYGCFMTVSFNTVVSLFWFRRIQNE